MKLETAIYIRDVLIENERRMTVIRQAAFDMKEKCDIDSDQYKDVSASARSANERWMAAADALADFTNSNISFV